MSKKRQAVRSDRTDKHAAEVKQLVLRLKAAIEQRDWTAVEKLCPVTVWNLNRPVSTTSWIVQLKNVLARAKKVELSFLDLKEFEVAEKNAHVSFRTQLIWSVSGSAEERELGGMMSLGFTRGSDRWNIQYLGIFPMTAAPVEPARLPSGPISAYNLLGVSLSDDNLRLRAEGSLFSGMGGQAQTLSDSGGGGDFQLMYLPVLIPKSHKK